MSSFSQPVFEQVDTGSGCHCYDVEQVFLIISWPLSIPPVPKNRGLIHQTERSFEQCPLKLRIGVCLCILLRTPVDLFPSPHSEVKMFFKTCQSFLDFQLFVNHLKFSKVLWHIVSYCWWFRNPAPVDVSSLSQGYIDPRWLAGFLFAIDSVVSAILVAKGEFTPMDLQFSWSSFSETRLAARSPEGEDFGTFKFEEWNFHVGGVTSATSELFGTSWYEAW